MPTTSNGLPYPARTGGQPDVQADIKALAEALDSKAGETPGAWLVQTSAQSVPNDAITPLAYQVINQIRGGMSLGSSGVVVPRAGWYMATAAIRWAGNTTGTRHIRLHLNSSTLAVDVATPPTGTFSHTVAQVMYCGVGEEIIAACYQTSGGALSTSPAFSTFFSVVWTGV